MGRGGQGAHAVKQQVPSHRSSGQEQLPMGGRGVCFGAQRKPLISQIAPFFPVSGKKK